MPTVWREDGLRVVIYTDDHAPAHVHIFGDEETKVLLVGPGGKPSIQSSYASLRESRRALQIVREKQEYLIERWNEIHG